MHDGCSGSFTNGIEVLQKIRAMGFSEGYTPVPLQVTCGDCGKPFEMLTFEAKCTHCGMIHAVTPCHAYDGSQVLPAGHNL